LRFSRYTIAARASGGIRAVARTEQLLRKTFTAFLLAGEVCVAVYAFTILGLINSQAVFICYPLLISALSGPLLGERVGSRRWATIGVGFSGATIVLQPEVGVFDPAAAIPLISALMFALHGLLTRLSRAETARRPAFSGPVWQGPHS